VQVTGVILPNRKVCVAQRTGQIDVSDLDIRAVLFTDEFAVERQLQVGPASIQLAVNHERLRNMGFSQKLVFTQRRSDMRLLGLLGFVRCFVVQYADLAAHGVPVDAVDAAFDGHAGDHDGFGVRILVLNYLPSSAVPQDLPLRERREPSCGAVHGKVDAQPRLRPVAVASQRAQAAFQPVPQNGFFIGAGIVEAVCRTDVARRCKQSGMYLRFLNAAHFRSRLPAA